MEDSLKMIQMPDGRYKIEWDKNDPRYLFLNSLTEDQIVGRYKNLWLTQIKACAAMVNRRIEH